MADLTAHGFSLDVTARTEDWLEYRIQGSISCDRDGYSFALEPDNEGIVPTPESAALRLVVDEPEAGPEVETEEPVNYTGSDEATLKVVTIRLRGSVRNPDGNDYIQFEVPA